MKCVPYPLTGTKTNRAAIGARVRVLAEGKSGARAIHRAVGSGGSFGASTLRVEIGLGDCERIREIVVSWPGSGATETFKDVALNTRYRCVEGQGRLEPAGPMAAPDAPAKLAPQ
jgi:hypothetical protein